MSKKQKWYTNLYNLLPEFMFLSTLYKTTLLKHIKMLKQNQIKKKTQLHQNSKLPSFCSSCVIFGPQDDARRASVKADTDRVLKFIF